MPASPARRRWPVLAGLALAAASGWALLRSGAGLEMLVAQQDRLVEQVGAHPVAALAAYGAAYIVIVVLALPGALLMTLLGGWLFGPWLGGLAAVVAASSGAIALFFLARGLLHDVIVARSGAAIERIRAGFHADAAAYLLVMRLAPAMPFFLVNIAAALLGARTFTYIWTTIAGIMPGTFAYALAGSGLGAVLDREAQRIAQCRTAGRPCATSLDVSALISPETGLALFALAGISLLSIFARRWLAPAERGPLVIEPPGQQD